MQPWSLLATVVLCSAACSSSTSGTPAAGGSQDASSPEGSADAAADGLTDSQADSGAPSGEASTHDDGSVADAGEAGTTQPGDGGGSGVNACAACTVQMCMAQLQGCGASQACLGALQAFNTCYGASPDGGAECGAMLAASGPEGATLWQCLSTSCTSACG